MLGLTSTPQRSRSAPRRSPSRSRAPARRPAQLLGRGARRADARSAGDRLPHVGRGARELHARRHRPPVRAAGPTAGRASTRSSCPATATTLTATYAAPPAGGGGRRARGGPRYGDSAPGCGSIAPAAARACSAGASPTSPPRRACGSRCARTRPRASAATGTRAVAAGSASACTRCSTHVWMRAPVTAAGASAWRWRLRLGGELKRGRYVVAARVTEQARPRAGSGAPQRSRVR